MIYINFKKTVIVVFIIIISVIISGCGKKVSNEVTENTKKNESSTDNSNMSQNKNMSDKSSQDHIMVNLPTMQCGTCKKNIETAVNKLDGIESINVDKKEKIAHINFDKSKTHLSKIEFAITAAGYDANDKKADPEAYKNLDDCCKLPKDRKEKNNEDDTN